MSILSTVLLVGLLTTFPAIVWGFYTLGLLCLGGVIICALAHGTARLGEEWRAMWHPLRRLCPPWLRNHLWAVGVCLSLIVPTVAHTVGALLTVALR